MPAKENLWSRFKIGFGVLITDLEIFSAVRAGLECIERRSAATDEILRAVGEALD